MPGQGNDETDCLSNGLTKLSERNAPMTASAHGVSGGFSIEINARASKMLQGAHQKRGADRRPHGYGVGTGNRMGAGSNGHPPQ